MTPDDLKNKRQERRSYGGSGFSLPSRLQRKNAIAIYWGFVLAFIGCMGSLVYIKGGRPREFNGSINTFYTLNEVYRTKGIERFQEEKENLKDVIKESIRRPENDEVKRTAESIAVYLFPEVLPDNQFEKEAAMTLWAPLLREIEKKPGTADARNLYEEAKAEIWNYENPDRRNPNLSQSAKETLKIYRELSVK